VPARPYNAHEIIVKKQFEIITISIVKLSASEAEAKRGFTLVRQSVVEEKQFLEQRLDEERRAKERVRHQPDARMDELSKRKSKFVCI
jgi:hypothetical protein